MPGLSHAQILGFASDVEKALEAEAEALRKMGVDPEKLRVAVRTLIDRAVGLNTTQESLKRDTVLTTTAYRATIGELYTVSSGALDTLLAAQGKTSDAAKITRRIRSRIRRPRRPGGDEVEDGAAPPAPEPSP